MKWLIVIGGTLIGLALAATSASASGLTLNWGSCFGDGQHPDQTFGCADSGGVYRLVMTLQPPAGVPNLVAVDMSLDLQVAAADLAPFWHFEETGCNALGLTISSYRLIVPHTGCSAAFTGTTGASVTTLITAIGPGFGGVNRVRILATTARATEPIRVTADADYYMAHLEFSTSGATEAGGSCNGCTLPVAIVWNSAQLYNLATSIPGSEAAPIQIDRPGLGSNCATMNGGTSICAATPVHDYTWGRLKALYR